MSTLLFQKRRDWAVAPKLRRSAAAVVLFCACATGEPLAGKEPPAPQNGTTKEVATQVKTALLLGKTTGSPADPKSLEQLSRIASALLALPDTEWPHAVGAYYQTALCGFEGKVSEQIKLARGFLETLPFGKLESVRDSLFLDFKSQLGNSPEALRDAFLFMLGNALCESNNFKGAETLVKKLHSKPLKEGLRERISHMELKSWP